MTKLFTRVAMIAVLMTTVIVENAWADTKTDIMFAKGFGGYTSGSYSAAGTDRSAVANSTNATGVTYAMQVFNGSTGAVRGNQTGASNYSCRNTTTKDGYYISSVTLTVSGGTIDGSVSGRSVVYFGSSVYANPNTSAPTGSSTTASPASSGQTTLTWTNNDEDVSYFILYALKTAGTALSANASTSLSVEWTQKSGGGSPLSSSDLALTGAPVTLNFDLYNNSTAQTVTYTTSSTGAVTVSGAASYVTTSVNSGTKTITVTPTAVTPSAQTITVNQAADATYASGSATFTVNVTDSTPFAGGDVTFDATRESGSSPLQKNGVTFSCSNGVLNNGTEYRLYKSSVTTFSVSEGVITQIAFTGVSDYPASGFASQAGWTTNGNNGTWTGSASSVSFTASGAQVRASQIVVTVDLNGTPAVVCAAPTFSLASGAYVSTQNITITSETDGATIYYTTDGTNPTTSSSVYSSAIPVSSTTTIKAFAAKDGCENSSIASATYVILAHAGTEQDPYTVSDARAAIDAGAGLTGVYATGIVSQIVTPLNNGVISYNITADGTVGGDFLQAYKGKNIGGANFTSADDIMVGDEVVVYGNLTKYSETYEFASNNQLVSRNRPVTPLIVISTSTLSGFTYEEGNGPSTASTFTVSGSNLTANISLSLSGDDYEISLSENTGYTNSLSLVQSEGSVATTTVYVRLKSGLNEGSYSGSTITLSSTGASNQTVNLSGTVTPAPVPASLPFSFDGGKNDIDGVDGLTQSGLASDYAASPKLKFDNAGDYVILFFDARPGTLTFDLKGNGSGSDPWSGVFTVEESADGTNYTTLQEYTAISSSKQSEELTPASATRYIRWTYSTKTIGNVAMGNISLAEYSTPVPSITVAPDAVNATTSETLGSLAITYHNISISDESDFGIQFYDSEDNEISDPSWVAVVVEEDNGNYVVSYVIEENDNAPRTAYFKVYAMGPEDLVYSNLVTFSQAGLPTTYALLPFSFNGGLDAIAETSGLSQEGLGSDYASGPKLKFNDTGDNVILKINETPGILTFDINGNSFSGGTFTVQASANGIDYTDVASYTSLGETQTETISDLASNVRFIKWIYTTKVSGNVGVGNISLTKPAAAETIELTAVENGGRYWATFYSGSRYTLSGGVQAFTINSSKQLYLLGDDGSVIPAGTAVVLISDTETITLTKSNASGAVTVHGGANILVGSDSPVAKYSISGTPYVLGIKGGTLGFYEFTGSGIPANKAYYIVTE